MAKRKEEQEEIKRGPGRPRKVVSESEPKKKVVTKKAKPKVTSKKVQEVKKVIPKKRTPAKKATPKAKVEKASGTNEAKKERLDLFQPGNQLWQLRSKDGRDKEFSSPLDLWKRGCEYFDWQDNNPFIKEEWKSFGGVATRVETRVLKPYTLIGMCIFLNVSSSYFRTFKSIAKKKIAENTDLDVNTDFLTVIEKLEEIIYNQKFEGAASNFLNSNIIARDLGLSDKREEVKKDESEGKTKEELLEELEKIKKWEK